MNNVTSGQPFRPRRNNNNYKKNNNGGGGRQDFRRGSNNNSGSNHSFNTGGSNNSHARHPELDIVIDSRAAQRASTMRDKYQSMARDAQTGGDRVYAEYCLQHTEHYNRIINAYNESRPVPQPRPVENNENNADAQAGSEQPENAANQATPAAPAAPEESYQAAASN